MPLQEIYYIAEMVVGVAVIISIVFVAIELRQNTYVTRKAMADQRRQRENWFLETLCTDSDFRKFNTSININWDDMEEDERYRAIYLGFRTVQSILDELVAYFDGQISTDEFLALDWNIKIAATRPHCQQAYQLMKEAYSPRVQKYWEAVKPDGNKEIGDALFFQ